MLFGIKMLTQLLNYKIGIMMNITEVAKIKNPDGSENTNILKATINDIVYWIPKKQSNTHYAEILKQVKAGTLTIKDAD